MGLQQGAEGTVSHVVTDADTALARGSGDVEVLATPTVVRLCEQAAVQAIAGSLEDGTTSVGVRISLDHLAPTVPGRRVEAHAVLESVDGRRLEFLVDASDETGPIAKGLHTRVIVQRDAFLRGAAER